MAHGLTWAHSPPPALALSPPHNDLSGEITVSYSHFTPTHLEHREHHMSLSNLFIHISQNNNITNDGEFEVNDQYIDDELEHYFVDPEGLNLMNPFATSNDQTHAEDPEPSPGPFDPG